MFYFSSCTCKTDPSVTTAIMIGCLHKMLAGPRNDNLIPLRWPHFAPAPGTKAAADDAFKASTAALSASSAGGPPPAAAGTALKFTE